MAEPLLNKLVSMLAEAAETGARMPTKDEMLYRVGVGAAQLQRLLDAAVEQRLIRIRARSNGCRRVEIVATGKLTDWNHAPGRRRKEKACQGEALPEDVQQAKLWPQRRDYPVYRAKTAGLSKDPSLWVIGVRDKFYTDAQLVSFARSRGWKKTEGRAAA